MEEHRVITVGGGRKIGLATYGDAGGWPVFAFHGIPASRLSYRDFDEAGRRIGARVLCPDRPGIGLSSPARLDDIASYTRDLQLLADELDVERFAVLGWSCGGPYALAAGALLSERVAAVGLVAGMAPLDWTGAREGFSGFDQKMMDWAEKRPLVARLALGAMGKMGKYAPRKVASIFEDDLSPADLEAFRKRSPKEALAFFVEAFRQGPAGAVEDYRRLGSRFGFELAEVSVPVEVWQGEDDRMVPRKHAEHQADALPDASLHLLPREGHVSITLRGQEILESLNKHVQSAG